MTTEDMIRALGNVIEEYKNKPVFTGQTDIPMMCRDVIGKLKELSSPWHTWTPTEEGNYIAHLRIKSRDGEFIEYDMTCNLEVLLNYIRCQDESEENYLMVKGWLRYEPYKED